MQLMGRCRGRVPPAGSGRRARVVRRLIAAAVGVGASVLVGMTGAFAADGQTGTAPAAGSQAQPAGAAQPSSAGPGALNLGTLLSPVSSGVLAQDLGSSSGLVRLGYSPSGVSPLNPGILLAPLTSSTLAGNRQVPQTR